MKKILTLLFVLFSLIVNSQQNHQEMSPNGIFDDVFDRFGNKYSLEDIRVDTRIDSNGTQKTVLLCTAGYFDLFFESGSGMEGTTPIELARRNVLCQVFSDLSQFITPADPNVRVNIWVRSIANIVSNPSTSGVLGLASGFYTVPAGAPTFSGIVDNEIWKTINSGTNSYTNVASPLNSLGGPNASFYHGVVAFNFSNTSINWHTNLSQTTTAGLYDMYTIALHEATHALGFASLIDASGASKLGAGNQYYSRYDLFLRTSANQPLITNTGACTLYNFGFNPSLNPNVMTPSPFNCATHIQFAGTVNQAAFSPSTFAPPSSLSHLEDICHSPNSFPNDQYYVMSDANGTGATFMKRFLKAEERRVLCDIGYTVNTTYGSAGNLNFFNYGGSACPGLQVAGINDGINPGGFFQFTVNVGGTIPVNGVLSNDFNAASFECLQDIYGNGTVSTTSGTTFNYTGTAPGLALLRYIPVSSSGNRGNITYIYIYVLGGNCVPNACDIISNGGFENSLNCGQMGADTPPPSINCWTPFSASPDLYVRNCFPANNPVTMTVPTPDCNPISDTWNNGANANNTFLGLWSRHNSWNEAIQNNLSSPIQGNSSVNYVLSFRARVTNNATFAQNLPVTLIFAGSQTQVAPIAGWYNATPAPLSTLVTQVVPNNNQWNYFSIPFTNTNSFPINFLTVINAAYSTGNPANHATRILIDDISILVNGTQPTFTPTSPVCINQTLPDLSLFVNLPGGDFVGNGVVLNSGIYSFDAALAGVGTHLITYTYTTPTGCVQNVSANITVVNANINLNATPNPANVCIGGTSTITATGASTYVWNPGNFSGNPYIVTLGATTTYTVTGTDANGCTATTQTTVNIDPTCCTANNNITAGTYNNLTLNFAGGPYAIQGNIVLTGTCSFANADIRLSDNVSITVSPGSVLTINGLSRLYSCNSMWDGIFVQPGGQLIITGGLFRPVIEDAKAAVVSVNGADIRLSNCDLNRNLVGIYFTAFTGVHPAVIGPRVNITTVNSLIPANNIQTATLDNPSLNTNGTNRTIYGIYIPAGSGTLNIGVNNIALAQRNVFDNLDFGIHASAVNLNINCNTFRNIRGPISLACLNFPHCPPEIGTAIYATTKELRNISIGTTAQFNNDFTNCRIGIHTFDYNNVSILRNTFTAPVLGSIFSPNGSRAVEVVNNANFFPNITVNINNNEISDYGNAIRYTYSDMTLVNNTTLNINQNNIKRTLNKTVSGIIVQSLMPPSGQNMTGTNNWNINQNTFPLNTSNPNSPLYSLGVTNGIQILNIQGVTSNIGSNTVNITQSTNRTGIRVSNCNNLTVQGNTIKGTGITAAEINHRGIWVSLSPKCTFKCNSIQTTGQALVFEGMCITASILGVAGNTINNAYRGLVLQNSGEIGQQGNNTLYSDNRWQGTFTDRQTYVANTANANTASRLFVRSIPAIFRPTNHGNLFPSMPYANGFGIVDYTGGSPFLCPIIAIPVPLNPLFRSVARNEVNYDNDTRWISRYGLYNAINKDPDLAQQDPVLDSFYVAEQNGFYGQLKQVYEYMADSNYAAASAVNSSLNTIAQTEENYRLYNAIAIRLAMGDSLNATDVDNLLYIAEQCPFTGGAIVYQARAFINFIYAEEIDFEDVCSEERSFTADAASSASALIKLYPNPNAGEFTLLYDTEETAPVLEVYDISGKLLLQQNLPATGRCEIKLNYVEQGMYFYKVYSTQKLLGVGKIEIVK